MKKTKPNQITTMYIITKVSYDTANVNIISSRDNVTNMVNRHLARGATLIDVQQVSESLAETIIESIDHSNLFEQWEY